MINSALFFGRTDCKYSLKIKNFLKKKIKRVDIIISDKEKKINISKYLKKNYDFIFCFRSKYILKENLIKRSKFAINFHPSLPKYRGVGGINYAIYNNDKFFGHTVHIINKKIDNGKILHVDKFRINKKKNLNFLLNKTHKRMFNNFLKIVNQIHKKAFFIDHLLKKKSKYQWSKNYLSMNDLNKFYEIKKNESKKNLLKKIRSTIVGKHKPYIKLHKRKFYLA
jgi:methionyl-tRNA formyltransferase